MIGNCKGWEPCGREPRWYWGSVWGSIPVNAQGAQWDCRCIPVNAQRDQWDCTVSWDEPGVQQDCVGIRVCVWGMQASSSLAAGSCSRLVVAIGWRVGRQPRRWAEQPARCNWTPRVVRQTWLAALQLWAHWGRGELRASTPHYFRATPPLYLRSVRKTFAINIVSIFCRGLN